MSIQFGTEKTSTPLDDFGSIISSIKKIRKGETAKTLKQYRIRVKVANSQQEMTEFIKFSDELRLLREAGTLTIDKEDSSTVPAFIVEFPKFDYIIDEKGNKVHDGSYFIVMNWCELVL